MRREENHEYPLTHYKRQWTLQTRIPSVSRVESSYDRGGRKITSTTSLIAEVRSRWTLLKTRSPYTLRFSDEVLIMRRGLKIVVGRIAGVENLIVVVVCVVVVVGTVAVMALVRRLRIGVRVEMMVQVVVARHQVVRWRLVTV